MEGYEDARLLAWKYWQSLEARRGKEIVSISLWRMYGPAGTLLLAP